MWIDPVSADYFAFSIQEDVNLNTIQDGARSMSYQTYFHGSLHSQIAQFAPFSHFGTRLAACHAVARKIGEGAQGTPTLYHVHVPLAESQFLDLEDWGVPHCIGLARKLRDSIRDKNDSCEMEKLRAELVSRKIRREEWRDHGFDRLSLFLEARGVRALRYLNVVEGLRGTHSLCVILSSSVEILQTVSLDVAELTAASKSLRIKAPPITL